MTETDTESSAGGGRSYLRHIATLTLGTIIAQIINIASSPILGRLYSPEQFGDLALFTGTMAILVTLATGRYELALIVCDDDDVRPILRGASKLAIIIASLTVIVTAALVLVGPLRGVVWVLLLGPATLLNAAYHLLSYHQNRLTLYSRLARAAVARAIASATTSISAGALGAGTWGLVVAPLVALTTGTIALIQGRPGATGSGRPRDAMRRHHRFPVFTLPASLLDVVTQELPVFIITVLFSKALAGSYGIAIRILLLPMHFVGAAVGQVFYERFSKTTRGHGLLLRTWLGLFALGVLPMAAIFFYGPELFRFALGPQWDEAGRIASVLAPMALVRFVSSPASTGLLARGLQNLQLGFGLAQLIYRPLAFWIGYVTGDLYVGLQIWVAIEICAMLIYDVVLWKSA